MIALKGLSSRVLSQKADDLLSFLSGFKPRPFKVTVMPDFFLDRFVSWSAGVQHFAERILEVVNRKGGSVDHIPQIDSRGGNAVNTAAALSAMGVDTSLIVCTSKLGLNLLKLHLKQPNVDLSHIKIQDSASVTTALEFSHLGEKRNVMLRDLGSLEDFGPKNLTENDYELLETTDYACVFNWAGTRKHGTELAETVFHHVKAKGKGKTYFDSADPLPNRPGIPRLVEKVLLHPNLINILSLNENEAITYSLEVEPKKEAGPQRQLKGVPMPTAARSAWRLLQKRINSRIDLHTTAFSATSGRNGETIISTFDVKVLRATGAGDAWNAANIFADANDFPDELRLTFANAAAAYYLSNKTGMHSTLLQLRDFIERALKEH